RGDDHHAAHGRRTALGVVAGGTVVADRLPVPELIEQRDGGPGAEQREHQGEASAQQYRLHRLGSSPSWLTAGSSGSVSTSATCSRAAPRDALTRITSRATALCRSQSAAWSRPAVGTAS